MGGKHPTSNIQHRTTNGLGWCVHWAKDVGRSLGSSLPEEAVNAVGGALGTGAHGVGLVVAYEDLLDGVPRELGAQRHGGPAEDAGGGGAVRFFGRGDRRFAGSDAG